MTERSGRAALAKAMSEDESTWLATLTAAGHDADLWRSRDLMSGRIAR